MVEKSLVLFVLDLRRELKSGKGHEMRRKVMERHREGQKTVETER